MRINNIQKSIAIHFVTYNFNLDFRHEKAINIRTVMFNLLIDYWYFHPAARREKQRENERERERNNCVFILRNSPSSITEIGTYRLKRTLLRVPRRNVSYTTETI